MTRCRFSALVLVSLACIASGCGRRPPLPAAPQRQVAASLTSWQQPPALAPDQGLKLGWVLRRARLDNGLGVTVVSRPDTPTTAIHLSLPDLADPYNGRAVFMAEALRAGTRVGEHVLVNPQLGHVPIGIGTSSTGTRLTWNVLPQATRQAIELLSAFALKPTFEEEEVQIRRQRELAAIKGYSIRVAYREDMARAALPGIVPPDPEGDARQVRELDPATMDTLHRCTVHPEGAELVIVGPLDPDQAIGWIQASFGQWPHRDTFVSEATCARFAPEPAPAQPTVLETAEIRILEMPFPQRRLMLALAGPAPDSPDTLAFTWLSRVLGEREANAGPRLHHSGTTNRLTVRLNSTYGSRSTLEVHGLLETDAAADAIVALVDDIHGLAQSLTAPELDAVKRRWRTQFVDSLWGNASMAEAVLGELLQGRPPRLPGEWFERVTSVDLDQCKAVAERWLTNAQPSIAIAGFRIKAHDLGFPARVHYLK